VVYVGIMGMTRAVWVGHGLPGLIARTASGHQQIFLLLRSYTDTHRYIPHSSHAVSVNNILHHAATIGQ